MALMNLIPFAKKKKHKMGVTHITKNIQIIGEFISGSPLFIDSKVEGDIKVNNTVIVSKKAVVEGNIQAKSVIVHGKTKGKIKSKNLEVYESGQVRGNINVKKVYIDGHIFGSIGSEGIFIDTNGHAKSVIQAKISVINGTIDGSIASKVLETQKNCYIRGNVFVERMPKRNGKIEGSISNYKEILSSEHQFDYDYEDSVEKMSKEVAIYRNYESKIIDLIKRNMNNDAALEDLVGMLKYSPENEKKLNQITMLIEQKKSESKVIDVDYE